MVDKRQHSHRLRESKSHVYEWLITHIVFQKPQRIVGRKRQDGGEEGREGEKNTNVLIGPGPLPDPRQPIVIG